jgi:hypothetical protein
VNILSKAKEAMNDTSLFCIINTSPYFTAMANGCSKMYHSKDFIKLIEMVRLKVDEISDHLGGSSEYYEDQKRSI